MNTRTAFGVAFFVLILAVAVFLFEAWLLGIILGWFGVTLSFWQNLAIIALANMIFKNTGVNVK